MSKKKTTTITLSPDGAVGVELDGFEGSECLRQAAEAARAIEAMGVTTHLDPGDIKMKMKETRGGEKTVRSARQRQEVKQ